MKIDFSLAIATQNLHKIEEIKALLPYPFVVPNIKKHIPENDVSYLENALTKARAWAQEYPDAFILADDSGIEVDVLDGAPGVISADWAGIASPQEKLIEKMLAQLENVPLENRSARMVCTMLILSPKGNIFVSRGECLGRIALKRLDDCPFGYDPLFLSTDYHYQRSFSQLSIQEKNTISHRARALLGVRHFFESGEYCHFL